MWIEIIAPISGTLALSCWVVTSATSRSSADFARLTSSAHFFLSCFGGSRWKINRNNKEKNRFVDHDAISDSLFMYIHIFFSNNNIEAIIVVVIGALRVKRWRKKLRNGKEEGNSSSSNDTAKHRLLSLSLAHMLEFRVGFFLENFLISHLPFLPASLSLTLRHSTWWRR